MTIIAGYICVAIAIVLAILGTAITIVGFYVMRIINREQRQRIAETTNYYGDPDAD